MADYIAISNTGKTITVSMSKEFHARWKRWVPIGCIDDDGRVHAHVVYADGVISINPANKGRRIGSHGNGNGGFYTGMATRHVPTWPRHGKVVIHKPIIAESNGGIRLELPDVLPAPKLRNTASTRVHETRTDYSHVGAIRDAETTAPKDMLEHRESLTVPTPAEPTPVAPAPICHYGLFKVPTYQWDTVLTVMEALGCKLADKISAT